MTRALFVSDIHIQSAEDPKHQLFLRFLDHLIKAPPQHLFLVGDIFDLWIADRPYFLKRFPVLIERLRDLRSRGVQIHYFEGNHDLDLRVFFQHQLGLDVHDGASFFSLGQRRLRVEHGDEMDPEDKGYRFLRWFLRTPVMRWLGRALPNAAVAYIGERASRASRDYTSHVKTTTDTRSLQVLREHARRVHARSPFDVFVSGHVHVAEDSWQEAGGQRFRCFNLGTWLKTPLALNIEGERMELVRIEDLLAGRPFTDSLNKDTAPS